MKKWIQRILITGVIFVYSGLMAEQEGNYTYIVTNGKATITGFSSSVSGDVEILSTLGGYPVTSIGNYAFYCCNRLTSIIIPEGVTSIGNYAFSDCSSLTSIIIPEGVTSISNRTFYNCSSLITITIPEGVISLGESAFNYCSSLTSINIPTSVTSIGDSAFFNVVA